MTKVPRGAGLRPYYARSAHPILGAVAGIWRVEMYKRVLIPIDGSSFSLAAIRTARHVIDPDGQVLLVEVIDSEAALLVHATPAGFPYTGGGMLAETAADLVSAEREAAIRDLAKARALLEHGGVRSVEMRVLEGRPGEAIVSAALAEQCDLVVMSTHGRSGLARVLLGSVAEYVVRHLRAVPVLLIRADGEEADTIEEPATTAATAAPLRLEDDRCCHRAD